MHRSKNRLSKSLFLASWLAIFWFAGAVDADDYQVSEPTDFYVEITEPSEFVAYTTNIEGQWSDPMLWLYDSEDQIVVANDDWGSLMSRIEAQLSPGVYRLRAGICCGDPDRWYQGWVYNLHTSSSVYVPTTTDQVTTSTVPETTTTTTLLETTTTSTTTSSTTVPESTTTLPMPEATTTTQPELLPSTTTTEPIPETTTTSSTSTVPQTTTSTSSTTTSLPATTTSSSTTTTSVPATTTVPTTTTTDVPPTEPTVPTVTDLAQMDDGQIAEVIEQLNEAPDTVKQQFEETVNVFDGRFDSYIPSGSKVPVGTRRALIAISATLFVAPAAGFRKW